MDFRLLESIVAICDEKSITRAAEKRFVTQSALNQQLQKLERELGAPLFVRTRADWHPTPAGEVYIETARGILQMKQDAYRKISDITLNAQPSYRIGLIPERGVDMFTAVYPAFHRAFPEVKLEPVESNVRAMQKEIAAGRMDLGLLTLTDAQKDGNAYIHMTDEEIFLAVPAEHPLASHGSPLAEDAPDVSLADFAEDDFILIAHFSTMHDLVMQLFEEAGFEPKVLFATRSNVSKFRMVAAGVGCALLPAVFALPHAGVRYFRLMQHPRWEVTMCHRKRAYLSRAEQHFLTLCQAYWQTNPRSPRNVP